ncbi:MAG: YfiR family protein [Anaerohalosphaeraceae bacterium]|nr:YfiR family protein [Anaerohalosphaeraceae bacterium]
MIYVLRKYLVITVAGLFIISALPQNICAKETTFYNTVSNTEAEREYKLQTAFIYNFMKFTEWPLDKNISSDSNEPMTIGIIGESPLRASFELILGKKINGRSLRIIEFPKMKPKNSKSNNWKQEYFLKHQEAMRKCYVLFISETEKQNLREINELVKDASVLTISNIKNFAEKGGMMGFLIENKKMRFETNLNSTNRERLSISSQLLRLAKRVIKK